MIVVNEGREPLELELDLVDPAEQQSVWKVLALQNKSANRCAFKIRTTSRERFVSRCHTPIAGRVPGMSSVVRKLCSSSLKSVCIVSWGVVSFSVLRVVSLI